MFLPIIRQDCALEIFVQHFFNRRKLNKGRVLMQELGRGDIEEVSMEPGEHHSKRSWEEDLASPFQMESRVHHLSKKCRML